MRPNVVIDDEPIAAVLKASVLKTKRQSIEEGLRLPVKTRRQARICRLRGKLGWEGSLDDMRRDP